MSKKTNEINRITGTIINVSVRLIIYILIILLLFQGAVKGYEFGFEIFHASSMAAAPGADKTVVLDSDSAGSAAKTLKNAGVIANELIFQIQAKFYDYKIYPGTYVLNTSMTTKDILEILNENPEVEEVES